MAAKDSIPRTYARLSIEQSTEAPSGDEAYGFGVILRMIADRVEGGAA